jgi:hypothetical protein
MTDASSQIDLRLEQGSKPESRQIEKMAQAVAQENEQQKNVLKNKIKDLEAEVCLKTNKATRLERSFN